MPDGVYTNGCFMYNLLGYLNNISKGKFYIFVLLEWKIEMGPKIVFYHWASTEKI